MFLVLVYIVLITIMLTQITLRLRGRGDDNDSGDPGGDGGWGNQDDVPPIDLPPGVYFLPPDAEDPSLRRMTKKQPDALPG